MDQTVVNWMLAGFGGLIGFLLNAVWQAVKDLQKADKELTAKVAEIEVLEALPGQRLQAAGVVMLRLRLY